MVQTAIEAMLRQRIGLDAKSIGSNTISYAIEQRRLQTGLPNLRAYCDRLESSSREWEALVEAVVVPETWFFRDREPFIYLTQWIKTQWKQNSSLRVLSAPCSTGEEPYSIAITLLEAGLKPDQFRVDAVDISQAALEKANRAIYTKRSFRGGSSIDPAYFQEINNHYEVRLHVRKTVHFTRENLLKPEFLRQQYYQVIFCRNLLIYLDQAARSSVMNLLDRALISSGLLFLGSAETSQILTDHYQSVNHPAAFAYRKIEPLQTPPPKLSVVKPLPKPYATPMSLPAISPSNVSLAAIEQAQQMFDRGQLTEAAQLCQLHLNGERTDAKAYLLLGKIYQELKRLPAAEQALQRAIYLNPQFCEALIELALLKEQQGDTATATILNARVQRLLNL